MLSLKGGRGTEGEWKKGGEGRGGKGRERRRNEAAINFAKLTRNDSEDNKRFFSLLNVDKV